MGTIELLNFATNTPFHPVDHFIFSDTLKLRPPDDVGGVSDEMAQLLLGFQIRISCTAQPDQMGLWALSRAFVTPWFHSFSRSINPRRYCENFGGLLTN